LDGSSNLDVDVATGTVFVVELGASAAASNKAAAAAGLRPVPSSAEAANRALRQSGADVGK